MKVGKLVLHAEELIHRVVIKFEALTLDLALQEPVEHMGREALRLRLAGERILRAGVRDPCASARPHACSMRRAIRRSASRYDW